ncbi:DUF551 domain-containing protein [Mannheimia indoligenes]|uniref:DUF551 domain-containing protein n=1 Tax=Mannheimia indoligenes TaxID=3103145 RepID=UPI002FE68B76
MENSGWIKTKDRLPELNGFGFSAQYLLWGQEEENDHEEMIFLGSLCKNGEWYSLNGKCFNVIYWQPLPAPPCDD